MNEHWPGMATHRNRRFHWMKAKPSYLGLLTLFISLAFGQSNSQLCLLSVSDDTGTVVIFIFMCAFHAKDGPTLKSGTV